MANLMARARVFFEQLAGEDLLEFKQPDSIATDLVGFVEQLRRPPTGAELEQWLGKHRLVEHLLAGPERLDSASHEHFGSAFVSEALVAASPQPEAEEAKQQRLEAERQRLLAEAEACQRRIDNLERSLRGKVKWGRLAIAAGFGFALGGGVYWLTGSVFGAIVGVVVGGLVHLLVFDPPRPTLAGANMAGQITTISLCAPSTPGLAEASVGGGLAEASVGGSSGGDASNHAEAPDRGTVLSTLTDGDIVAVLYQFNWQLGRWWNKLRARDGAIDPERIETLLKRLDGSVANIDGPAAGWVAPTDLAAEFVQMRDQIERIQAASLAVFDRPQDISWRISCTAPNPRTFYSLGAADTVDPASVNLLNLGENDWLFRSRVAEFADLREVTLENVYLDDGGLGINLAGLERLEAIELADCGVLTVPGELALCPNLRWVGLAANPINDDVALCACTALEYVEADMATLSPQTVAILSAAASRSAVRLNSFGVGVVGFDGFDH